MSKFKQWLKLVFLDKVKLRFSTQNSDMVYVTVTPRLLSRIINRLDADKFWMERYVNENGHVSWIAKDNQGLLIVHAGFVLHGILVRAHRRHIKSIESMPDAKALKGYLPSALTIKSKSSTAKDESDAN